MGHLIPGPGRSVWQTRVKKNLELEESLSLEPSLEQMQMASGGKVSMVRNASTMPRGGP